MINTYLCSRILKSMTMLKFYKRKNSFRESYVDTLAKLYDYATTFYPKLHLSKMADSDKGGYTFAEFKVQCDALSKKLTQYGIGAGDKVAILSQNMPNWTVAFFCTVPFGRISIPILPESSKNEVTNILNHSESKVLFVSQRLLPNVSQECIDKMTLVIDIETFEEIKKDDSKFTCDGRVAMPMPDDIATIIYTSGTTGNAKGVVLSHRNLTSCVHSCYYAQPRDTKDRWLSILPMSHTLELTLGVLYPMYAGATVYYMSKPPVPSLLLKAMQTVRPTTILSVPLIIEKIYRNSVVPTIKKSKLLSWMNENMNWLMCKIIGMKLKKTFGGKVSFFGIGGAKLDTEVETFLLKAGFPYAIGYGLTETSPLLSYTVGKLRVPASIGIPVKNVKLRLDNVNPETGEGEIVASGPNVMMGYYKDPERTRAAFTEDGWFRTGDMGVLDADGSLFIKGRAKCMILGPSGQNIYPEEVETVINNQPYVVDSLVIEDNGGLTALIYPDFPQGARDGMKQEAFVKYLEGTLPELNKELPNYAKLKKIEVMSEDFERTPKKSIKRYLYQR